MRKKKSWVGANHQTSASEKLQTPPMQLWLGDRAQDMLKSAPWEYKSRQLCQAWGATTALPEQARAPELPREQAM